ncbi:MAG TPA: mandelate racemase/muconate lactonizing enzyme family protein [Gaiellaceae bacterium]
MRITRIDTVRTDEFPSLLHVLVHTDEGLTGLGETFFFADAVEAHVHDAVADYLLGRDPAQIERHATALRGYVGATGSGAETRAASAIDVALWDLRGKALGQPVHDLLGGRSRDRIRTYNTCAGYRYVRGRQAQAITNWGLPEGSPEGPYEDLDAFLQRADELARSLLDQGITGMKIWPFDPYAEASLGHDISGADLDRALEPFRKIRAAVGSAMDVMVELHALWDVPAACRIVAALEEFEPFWIEDPVRVASPAALAEVQAATSAPIAAGETLSGLAAFRDLIVEGGAQIVIFDPGWVGGITVGRKVAALAEAHERPVAPHDCTGPVVYTAATHLSLHLPNAIVQESVRAFWSGWYRELVTALPTIEDGMVSAQPGPGLGTELRPEVFERPDVHVRTSEEST